MGQLLSKMMSSICVNPDPNDIDRDDDHDEPVMSDLYPEYDRLSSFSEITEFNAQQTRLMV